MPSSLNFEEELRNETEKFCLIAGDVMDERPAYSSLSLSSSSSSSSASASRVAATANGVAIGLNEDVMVIKDRLCGLSSKLQVVPILGMGGIGKTTLARTVYDDPLIMYHFDIRVWLTISQDYNARKVLLGLVDSMKLIEEHMSRLEMDDVSILAEKVYKNLKGRRYLVVMDDVWSTKVWDDVRNVFPDDGNGSRIMLTTRLADLAVYPDSSSAPHEMRFMNDSQSWDLLKGKVFADSNCPPELEDVGKKIARSCGGLPLAVVLVAGFLSEVNKNPSSWEEVSENVINPIVGQELEGILSLSYTHLPHHLRPCFLFMAMFPEDENIRASRLIRLWLAEGFLKHQNGCSKSLEEEAEEYLEDLVKRNLVIVTSKKSDGKIKCCSLHDMVRDLCIRKAHDEKFLRVIHGRVVPESMINERRISLSLSDFDDIWCPTIHTMLCFQLQSFSRLPAFLRRFRSLRILDAVSETSEELSSQGGKFPWEDMSIIGSLPNLQVLKLIDQTFGETWETADGEFPQLRYLLIERSGLQHWITESSHFPRLKCLVLRFCQDLREIPQGIGEIPTLEVLYIK
ncbi:putative late blight resistance protein homolog R1B-14 [Salvia hispanica]|uniref:putative late blight resistance protein homolog R1B-14 n=1 Tax=Salvia hispanica TaxID=49212 RepID=UPI002009C4F2|nr:putative late blight resistance protein homolog R1B-14 [Salvia hispanica]